MADAPAPQIALQPAISPGAGEAATPVLQSVPIAPLEIPDSLALIARPVQIGGLVVSVQETGAVEIQTGAGNFLLSLLSGSEGVDKSGAASARAIVTAFLKDVQASGKKVTLFLEPVENGNPKISLCIPREGKAAASAFPASQLRAERAEIASTPPLSVPQEGKESITQGKILTVTVLPEKNEKSLFVPSATSMPETIEKNKAASLAIERTHNQNDFSLKGDATVFALKSEPQTKEKAALFFAEAARTEAEAPVTGKIAPTLFKEGQETRMTLRRLVPPEAQMPRLEAGQILAEVVEKTQTGKAVLLCEGKTLLLHEAAELPEGTRLVLAPLPIKDREQSVMPPTPREREIASLRELVEALTEASPQTARVFLQDKLPGPGPQIGGTLLFLLSALQGGKIEEWMGNKAVTQMEKAGKKSVVDAFINALDDSNGATAADNRVGEWRLYPIPIHDGQKRFDMLRLYVRDGKKEAERGNPSAKQTHFLIAMNMSKLGPMQMDGLSRPGRLDLVVRSEKTLPENLPFEIKASYLGTLEALGLAGSIVFQTGREHWISIEEGKKSEGLEI